MLRQEKCARQRTDFMDLAALKLYQAEKELSRNVGVWVGKVERHCCVFL